MVSRWLILGLCLLGTGGGWLAGEEIVMTGFSITSPVFEPGQPIPRRHTCEGADVSPPLEWSGAPEATKSYALIVDDPDAPLGTWVHWVIYNLPASAGGLAENVARTETLPDLGDARQGINDFGWVGYGGPCPPPGHGPHHYHFKLYALDRQVSLEPGATKAELETALEDHILAWTELIGTYER